MRFCCLGPSGVSADDTSDVSSKHSASNASLEIRTPWSYMFPLHEAVHRGHVVVVQNLLKEACTLVDARDCYMRTALDYAAENGEEELVRMLLAAKANPNVSGWLGFRPIHWAARNSHPVVIALLLRAGARVDCVTVNMCTPLHLAVYAALCKPLTLKNVSMLTLGGARKPRRQRAKWLTVRLLLQVKADPNTQNDIGYTALHMAAEAGAQAMVRELLEAGGSPSVKNIAKQTPLDLAPKGSSARALLVRAVRKSQSLSMKEGLLARWMNEALNVEHAARTEPGPSFQPCLLATRPRSHTTVGFAGRLARMEMMRQVEERSPSRSNSVPAKHSALVTSPAKHDRDKGKMPLTSCGVEISEGVEHSVGIQKDPQRPHTSNEHLEAGDHGGCIAQRTAFLDAARAGVAWEEGTDSLLQTAPIPARPGELVRILDCGPGHELAERRSLGEESRGGGLSQTHDASIPRTSRERMSSEPQPSSGPSSCPETPQRSAAPNLESPFHYQKYSDFESASSPPRDEEWTEYTRYTMSYAGSYAGSYTGSPGRPSNPIHEQRSLESLLVVSNNANLSQDAPFPIRQEPWQEDETRRLSPPSIVAARRKGFLIRNSVPDQRAGTLSLDPRTWFKDRSQHGSKHKPSLLDHFFNSTDAQLLASKNRHSMHGSPQTSMDANKDPEDSFSAIHSSLHGFTCSHMATAPQSSVANLMPQSTANVQVCTNMHKKLCLNSKPQLPILRPVHMIRSSSFRDLNKDPRYVRVEPTTRRASYPPAMSMPQRPEALPPTYQGEDRVHTGVESVQLTISDFSAPLSSSPIATHFRPSISTSCSECVKGNLG